MKAPSKQPKRVTVEIVKQVKLTPAQRFALMAASNAGGVMREQLDYNTRVGLEHLKLIELRPLPRKGLAQVRKQIAGKWRELRLAVVKRNIDQAHNVSDDLHRLKYELDQKRYCLTDEARDYLAHGKVTVTL